MYTLMHFALVRLAIMYIHDAHSWMCSSVCGEHIIDVRPEPVCLRNIENVRLHIW